MTSVLTNTAAMTALSSLAATQKALSKVQKQISTGLAVNDASDNVSAWSMATAARADVSALGAVTSSINVGLSIVSTATPAISSALNLLNNLKTTLGRVVVSGNGIAAGANDSIAAIQATIGAQQQSIVSLIGSSAFGSVNLLDGSAGSANVNIIDAYARNANGTDYGSMTISTSGLALGGTTTGSAPSGTNGGGGLLGGTTGASSAAGTAGSTSSSGAGASATYAGTYASDSILGFSISASTNATDFGKISQALDAAITAVTTAGAKLGGYSTVLNSQSTAISALTDSTNAGIGSLVDADMNTASARLQALQVQQQLGIQALSIANENSQYILKLFGG